MLIFSYKKNFLIKVSCIHFLLKNLKLTFEETRIYSLECLNSYDLNEEENNFEGERKTKARRLCHLTKETNRRISSISATFFKRVKERRTRVRILPVFLGRREIFLNAVSIRHNKHTTKIRISFSPCAHTRTFQHDLLLSDRPRDLAPINFREN